MRSDLNNIEQMLDQIAQSVGEQDRVSLGAIVEGIGSRSFGPLLLLAGMVMVSPLSGMPGMPSTMATLVLLVAVQLIIGRRHFWLPTWLLNRSVKRSSLIKALNWMRKPARMIDRFLRPRFSVLVQSIGTHVIAVCCIMIAAGIPIMELVPFSASAAGVALTGYGLALVARDGLFAFFAYAWTAIVIWLIAAFTL